MKLIFDPEAVIRSAIAVSINGANMVFQGQELYSMSMVMTIMKLIW